ncbi:pantetheine-phosphate adenylyltransferase [Streptococcus cameli]
MKKIGLFTGSFDPITLGHLDLIKRAQGLFDHFYVGLFYNPHKQGLLSLEERRAILEETFAGYDNVSIIVSTDELAVDVARHYGVTHMVRGLRNGHDLEYEASLDYFNHRLAPEVETIYLLANAGYQHISSSRMRELIYFKQDISDYVPESVVKELEKRENK